MDRAARLASAERWLPTQKRRTPVKIAKIYRKRFGVDWPCALAELPSLGIILDAKSIASILQSASTPKPRRSKKKRKAHRTQNQGDGLPDSDGTFAYIAGYTEGGFPFGVTWEEWREMEAAEARYSADPSSPHAATEPFEPGSDDDEDEIDIPF